MLLLTFSFLITAGNILYLYLLCLNFTSNARRHSDEQTRFARHTDALNAILIHNKTVELLTVADGGSNDVITLVATDGAADESTSTTNNKSAPPPSSSSSTSYWRTHDLLTPLTNYFYTRLHNSASAHNNSYHASEPYVQWFCSRLEGNFAAGAGLWCGNGFSIRK